MTAVWVLVAISALAIGVLADRVLRARLNRVGARRVALVERLGVYQNYGKLAAVRRLEALEGLEKLRKELAEAEEELNRLQGPDAAVPAAPPVQQTIHVFDRVVGRKGALWLVPVETHDPAAPWAGVKHYVIVAETLEDARKRVQDRHPSISGFVVGQPAPLTASAPAEAARLSA